MHEPTYGQMRRAVYQMFAAESLYRSWGKLADAEECRRIGVEIMARMSRSDFDTLVGEMRRARRMRRILAEPI